MSEGQRVQRAHGRSPGQNDCTPEDKDIRPEDVIESGENVNLEVGRELGENVNLQEVQASSDINPGNRPRLGYMSLFIQKFVEQCLQPSYSYPEDRRLQSKDVGPEVDRVNGEEVNSEKTKPQSEVGSKDNRTLCDVIFGKDPKPGYATSIKTLLETYKQGEGKNLNSKVGRVLGTDISSEKGKPQYKFVNLEKIKTPYDVISKKVREPDHIPSVLTYFEAWRKKYANRQGNLVLDSKKVKHQCEDVNPEDSLVLSEDNHGKSLGSGYFRLFTQNFYDRYLKAYFGSPKEAGNK